MAWLPEWLSNLVFDVGYAGLGAEAAEVGDALAHLAALDIADEHDDFEAHSDIIERLEQLGRTLGPTTTVGSVGSALGRAHARSRRPGCNDPCFCGSGRKYKHCHGASSSRPKR
jgi:hypothetical protein